MNPMDMKETKRILAAITAIYPSFIKDRDPRVLSLVWQQVFANTPYPLVNQALYAFFSRCNFQIASFGQNVQGVFII